MEYRREVGQRPSWVVYWHIASTARTLQHTPLSAMCHVGVYPRVGPRDDRLGILDGGLLKKIADLDTLVLEGFPISSVQSTTTMIADCYPMFPASWRLCTDSQSTGGENFDMWRSKMQFDRLNVDVFYATTKGQYNRRYAPPIC